MVIVRDLTSRQREEGKKRRLERQNKDEQKPSTSKHSQYANKVLQMDHQPSSPYKAYDNVTIHNNTVEQNDATVIGGLSQGIYADGIQTMYGTVRGESPV